MLNKIPANKIDPIGQAILNLYPHANIAGAVYPNPNWRKVIIGTDPGWQFDVKVDHQFNTKHRIAGRYSRHHDQSTAPTIIGSDQGDGTIYLTNAQNGGVGVQLVRYSDRASNRPLQRGPRACARRK